MKMRISRNIVLAVIIFVLIGVWLASGVFGDRRVGGEKADQTAQAKTKQDDLFRVRARVLEAQPRAAELVIRGRTEAFRSVRSRAETGGAIEKLHFEKGDRVEKGDPLCEISVDARQAQLEEVRAALRKAQLDYEGSVKLAEKGYRSETQVAANRAALDAARAAVRRMEIEIERTVIRAPFAGVVDDRYVDVGDLVQPGEPCALVVDLDPIVVVGAVSEQEVGLLSAGDQGIANLNDGIETLGRIRFVSRSSDPATRTFTVELEVPNPDGAIRDGLTADIKVKVKSVKAHKVSPAILTLDDRGELGLRIVDDENTVQFVPVQIAVEDVDGVWVTGLPDPVTVITIGQEYVSSGQKVDVVLEGQEARS